MDAVALTDNGVLYGAIEFYQACQKDGIKPIIGLDAFMAQGSRIKPDPKGKKPWRLVLLAKNNIGYKNLIKLSTIGFTEGFFDWPRIDKEALRAHSEGLITLCGGLESDIGRALTENKEDQALEIVHDYQDMFGADNFYLELIDRPEVPDQSALNAKMIEFGRAHNVPLVAAKDTYYLDSDDQEACKVLVCIRKGMALESFNQMHANDYNASFVTPEYMEESFAEVPEAIANTRKIAEECNVTLDLGKWNFPKYDPPAGKSHLEYLTEIANKNVREKMGKITPEIQERVDYELSVIEKKGFAPYFLVVSDYLRWAEEQGIVTTTRGSAAGSLVSYAIGISHVDPMRYKLPFERFLNPERPSAPDVDGDFADNRRDEVLDYMAEKYGRDKMAQICTFGTMMARGSVRDVGRALRYPYGFCDRVAKMIPFGSQGFAMTIKRAMNENKELMDLYKKDGQIRRLLDLAQRIEGCARHVSIHAAGVVVAPTELNDFTPLQVDTREGKIITQYEMHAVEAAGLLKIDFLGIRNLSILGDAVDLVKKIKGKEINIRQIPVDDTKTFELLAAGNTMGVFQLGGDGMTKYLMELKPERIEDIMAMVALYRPGPIESIPEYVRRKHDPSLISFLDPRMESILDQSYGVIVYQDDVMLISIHLAGYSWLEADKLRKAMGKKIPAEMAAQKEKLLKGFVEHGLSEDMAQELWGLIEPFAAYGFNKAHAASYGMVAYQTAYMKANYPAEYMTALMTAESGDLEKIAQAVGECERMGISVLPPDINESRETFTYIDDETIRFGLLVVKNLGSDAISAMIAEREQNGLFTDLTDFTRRVPHQALNKRSLEALIKAGALDRFGQRKTLLDNTERILKFNRDIFDEQESGQSSLFESTPDMVSTSLNLKSSGEPNCDEVLAWEKEVLGMYVSSHPYSTIFEKLKNHVIETRDAALQRDGKTVRCGGLIKTVKVINTKKGDAMAFVGLEDLSGALELVVFPRTYQEYRHMIQEDKLVLVSGKISKRDGEETKILANSIFELFEEGLDSLISMISDNSASAKPKEAALENEPEEVSVDASVNIYFKEKIADSDVNRLRKLFQTNTGVHRVCFVVNSAGKEKLVETEYSIEPTEEIITNLHSTFGKENIEIVS